LEVKADLIVALSAVYPERQWHPWHFAKVPKGFWNDQENRRKFFDWFAQEMGITQPSDWYKVTKSILKGCISCCLL
jgi:hypothetical protein